MVQGNGISCHQQCTTCQHIMAQAHEMGTSQVGGAKLAKAVFFQIRAANGFLVFIFTANWVL